MSDDDKLRNIDWPAVRQFLHDLRKAYDLPEAAEDDLEYPLALISGAVECWFIGKARPLWERKPFGATQKEATAITKSLQETQDACLAAHKALADLKQVADGAADMRVSDALWTRMDDAKREYRNIGLSRLSDDKYLDTTVLPGVLLDICRFQLRLIADACEAAAKQAKPRGRPSEDRHVVAYGLVESLRHFLYQIPTKQEVLALGELVFGENVPDPSEALTAAYKDIRWDEIAVWMRRHGLEPEMIHRRENRLDAMRDGYKGAYRFGQRKGKGDVSNQLSDVLTPEMEAELYRRIWPQ